MADPSPDLEQAKYVYGCVERITRAIVLTALHVTRPKIVSSSIVVPASAEATSQRKRDFEEQTETNGQNTDGVKKSRCSKILLFVITTNTEYCQKLQKRPRLEMTQDGQRRGKRMFGVLMGTLNKFKTDTSTKSSAVCRMLCVSRLLEHRC